MNVCADHSAAHATLCSVSNHDLDYNFLFVTTFFFISLIHLPVLVLATTLVKSLKNCMGEGREEVAKCRTFFFLFSSGITLFVFSLGVLSRNFGGVFEAFLWISANFVTIGCSEVKGCSINCKIDLGKGGGGLVAQKQQ